MTRPDSAPPAPAPEGAADLPGSPGQPAGPSSPSGTSGTSGSSGPSGPSGPATPTTATATLTQAQSISFVRVSVRYDNHQDRLRVDAVDAAGATCALWLTRRLVGVWLAALAEWLQKASPAAAAAAAAPPAVREQAVAMESAVLVGRRAHDTAPAVPPRAVARLVDSIDLTRRSAQWLLVFKCPPDERHPLALHGVLNGDSATVHHLAQALVKQVQLATWNNALPMGWLDGSAQASPAAPGTLLN